MSQSSNANRVQKGILAIDQQLFDFIENEVLPKVGIDSDGYWSGFEKVIKEFTPRNKALLATRDNIQAKIDQWHLQHPAKNGDIDYPVYKAFLQEIGYLLPEGEAFSVSTENVDDEIALIAGPQLVVPVRNARYALNANNARWGSLYDALYGTNVISDENGQEAKGGYNPTRGAAVVAYAKNFLDENFTLASGSYSDVTGFKVVDGKLEIAQGDSSTQLKNAAQFAGFVGDASSPSAVLVKNNNLHAEIQIDSNHPIGKDDPANIKDVLLESALTAIQDCEDSIAAVDAEEKVEAYRNWFGLMNGDLQETFEKGGKTRTRKQNPDRKYTTPEGDTLTLPGRALLLLRNVGHLMQNPSILVDLGNGQEEVFEGLMDALITPLLSLNDLNGKTELSNSRKGSMYIVKPKMHGPDEVKMANDLFNASEDLLGLERHTIKIGIMDEERRMTVNLKEAIRQAKERVIFINTGFLDRTGDEMHTSMNAGPFVRKDDMKSQTWLLAYEQRNVDIGLEVGLQGHAQIGKGMWAKPDEMQEMMDTKIAHPKSGANTAWVPSPTGATLHSMHYHQVNVAEVQDSLKSRTRASVDDILTIPLAKNTNWTEKEKQQEIDNNAQGILGYVVRWVNQGVGCSKVPDINDVGLMEDRATLRISSQHIANWLHHNVVSEQQVMDAMKRMAKIVDEQNADDADYQPMATDFDNSYAFKAACDLVFKGREQPSGYTEPLLHQARLDLKASIGC
ncbi:malate synthase [Psychrobacter arcticus 273-4]|uniref:Malate synthase G n=1 Tax=Psychrobacter arcticus (strain DSM 17307 / VKM B-2377 / 273-4) TaxID=259536 RepID=Q4FR67_PSYA2|nr:malate synthase G [Psychrobacter arcticus]AAZ19491.1 malate synthase [Psychrobacter arcticus 273-4]